MKFEIYKDRKKEWRWRLKARNGKIIAVSGEGYKRKRTSYNIILKIIAAMNAEYTTITYIK